MYPISGRLDEKHTPVSRSVEILPILRVFTPTTLDSFTSTVTKLRSDS